MDKILELLTKHSVDITPFKEELETVVKTDFVAKTEFDTKNQELITTNASLKILQDKLNAQTQNNPSVDDTTAEKIKSLEETISQMQTERNRTIVENLFIKNGIEEKTYTELLKTLPLENEEIATNLVNNIISMVGQSINSVKKENLKNGQLPNGAVGNQGKTMTKEEFNQLSTAERLELLNSNQNLYNELAGLTK